MRKYLVLVLCAVLAQPLSAQLKSPSNRADYIIIYPDGYRPALESYISKRESQGLIVRSVSTSEIYSEFQQSGQPAQEAIREFTSYAMENWQNPGPGFLLIAGSADLVPSYRMQSMFHTSPQIGEDSVSIDNVYGINRYESDFRPDMAVGRLLFDSENELKILLEKIGLVEEQRKQADYPHTFTAFTDAEDGSIFESEAENIMKMLPPNARLKRIYARAASPFPGTREDFVQAVNSGSLFVSYLGRGNPYLWSQEKLFQTEDVSRIQSNSRPFFYTSMAAADHLKPGNSPGILRGLLGMPGGGASGALAPSGLTFAGSSGLLLRSFFLQLAKNPRMRIGEAMLIANAEAAAHSSPDANSNRFTLFGDPTMRLPLDVTAEVTDPETMPFTISPNPAQSSARLSLFIDSPGNIRIRLFDILGTELGLLFEGHGTAGGFSLPLDLSALAEGVYTCTVDLDGKTRSQKIIVLK